MTHFVSAVFFLFLSAHPPSFSSWARKLALAPQEHLFLCWAKSKHTVASLIIPTLR